MAKLCAGLVIFLNVLIVTSFSFLSSIHKTEIGEVANTLAFFAFPLVGAVLIYRHPRNPVGYLVAMLGLAELGASTLFAYSLFGLDERISFPLTGEAAWLSLIFWSLIFPMLVTLLLVFPDGRLPGERWKGLLVFVAAINLPMFINWMVVGWRNRAQLTKMDVGLVPYNQEMENMLRSYEVFVPAMIVAIILALVSFFLRFKRSVGIERLQLKWFVFGLSTIPASMVLDEFLRVIDLPALNVFNDLLNNLSIIAFPLVMLIAITRYRLYDIDFIIRRTLLYSALTITLALVYFGVVLVAQSLFAQSMFANRTGEQPAIVIVLSTLLIAALFQPLRRRFQSVIDRRFYRSKYNAEQMLERFATRLQNEVDLTAIERHFVTVVEENIQPENTQLWLIRKTELPGG